MSSDPRQRHREGGPLKKTDSCIIRFYSWAKLGLAALAAISKMDVSFSNPRTTSHIKIALNFDATGIITGIYRVLLQW